MEKVLISGGAGFIGSHLAKLFVDDGFEVFVLDGNIQYFYPLSKYSSHNMRYRHDELLRDCILIRGSTLDLNDLRRHIFKIKPDYFVNLAALPLAVTAVKNSEEAFSSILLTTHNIMELLRDYVGLKKYVHISSSMIYGDFELCPNPENASKNPIEIYGSMKLASEYIVKGYAKRFKIPFSIVRPSAVYGPTDNNQRVLQKFIEAALDGGTLHAKNPSTNILDFTYVKDAAAGIKAVTLSHSVNEEFNITRGEGRSLFEAIEIIRSILGEVAILVEEDTSGIYPKRGALDIAKARKLTLFDPIYSLEVGLREYVEFIRSAE
jgi:nucleoside-diphosphate-sugar epimerase